MGTCFRLLLVLVGFAALTACGGRAKLSAPEDAGSDDGVGSPSVDASVDSGDASIVPDAADDVADSGPDTSTAGDGGTVYHDMTNPSFWSFYSGVGGWAGGTFDGRYVYFAPNPGSVVTRYDTEADFTGFWSWTTFDTSALNPNAKAFLGAAFDGRYVYFVPGSNGLVVRYDTQAGFAATSSWSTFDINTTDAGVSWLDGAVFDGHYLYLLPGRFSGNVVARYDTRAAFAASSSWTTYTVPGDLVGGGVFDGRYVYLPTFYAGLLRYDTQASFTAASSWATNSFASGVSGGLKSVGLAFDGRYVYTLSPDDYTGGPGCDRYDTTASFTKYSWSYSLPTVNNGAGGAAFDGRYVYIVPLWGGAGFNCCQVVRYDTQLTFQSSAWSAFDTTAANAASGGFHGAVFDGRYVYLIPNMTGVVARFDAKTPPSMPKLPAWNGSFY